MSLESKLINKIRESESYKQGAFGEMKVKKFHRNLRGNLEHYVGDTSYAIIASAVEFNNVDIISCLLECPEVTQLNIDNFVYVQDPAIFEKILSSPKTHATSATLEKLISKYQHIEIYIRSDKFIVPDKETITSLFNQSYLYVSFLTLLISDPRVPLPDFTKALYEKFQYEFPLLEEWGKRDQKVTEMVRNETIRRAYSRTCSYLNMPFEEFKTRFHEKYPDGVIPLEVDDVYS